MSKPLTIPLTGHRRVLVDVDRFEWRVAFYQPKLAPREARRLERRALAGSWLAQWELDTLEMERTTGRGSTLNVALAKAWPGQPDLLAIEQVVRYVLDCGYAKSAA